MKSIWLILLLICLSSSIKTASILPSLGHINTDTIINAKVDTIIKMDVDTINNNAKRIKYVRQQAIIDSFSSHFIRNIAQPGDVNNPLYKEYIIKANSLNQKAKADLLARFKKYPHQLDKLRLKNEDEINNSQLIALPVYYLTYNVSLYNNESTITSFFNLDTSFITYRMIKNDLVIGIIGYQDGHSYLRNFDTGDSLGYYQVISMHKEPVAFIRSILDKKALINVRYDTFGYISNGHIIFISCSQGDYIHYKSDSNGIMITTPVYIKECIIRNAESYFLGADSTLRTRNIGMLQYIINSGYKLLNFRQKQQPNKN